MANIRIRSKPEVTVLSDTDAFLLEGVDGNDKHILGSNLKKAIPIKRGKSIFVDAVFGSDTTGTRDRFDLPYQTLGAAFSASASGDTLFVFQGSYTVTTNLIKNGIIWYFYPGVTVTFGSGASGYMFSDGGAARTAQIKGYADFAYIGNGAGGIYSLTNANSVIPFEGRDVSGGSSVALFVLGNSKPVITLRNIAGALTGGPLFRLYNATQPIISVEEMIGNTDNTGILVSGIGGCISLFLRIKSFKDGKNFFKIATDGESDTALLIKAEEKIVATDNAILIDSSDGSVYLDGGAYISLTMAAIKFNQSSSTSNLKDCVLIASGGNGIYDYALEAAAAIDVRIYGTVMANKAKNSNVTLKANPSGYVVSADVIIV